MYQLNGENFTDKETAYQVIIKGLNLPAYTGHNLDALWDVMQDQDYLRIEIDNARAIIDHLGEYGRNLLDLLGDIHNETDHQIVMYW
ncbi:barstar family protein [Facklamia sp. DSM 111018]|uniref:Barstar family protein n=1 Tax=Facklamia lactis TaxID=2749967 RepID=A0ABS0LS50_9LACT|nr:barstar family protein [Facklamia lactis]MBG9980357.1 barstar family protein [Facklamia lactis]MBG9986161.1 barstar family protein [Facklamia lactis]